MAKGDVFPAEWRTFAHPQTGVNVTQLTDYRGNSSHLYFTNPGWYADGRKLLFSSDRNNLPNLFGIDLTTGEITQLTDLPEFPPSAEIQFMHSAKNPVREEAYYWYNTELRAIDLETLEERVLYRTPHGFRARTTNVTADGAYVCTNVFEDVSDQFSIEMSDRSVRIAKTFDLRPLSRVVRIPVDGGSEEILFEDRRWLNHVNTSPTVPNILTYCQEGPWYKVEHRIWGLDMRTGETWKIRSQEPGERVGHEYWLADGEHIGYHGWRKGEAALFGAIRYDNTDRSEAPLAQGSMHFHSNDLDLVVGDGSKSEPQLRLWRFHEDGWIGPKILLTHRASFHIGTIHVHPRFTPDRSRVLFTSDHTGYANLYLADLPEFESLPDYEPVESPSQERRS